MSIIAMIPARAGSERIKDKNLRLMGGKTLVRRTVEMCKDVPIISSIYVNSEYDAILLSSGRDVMWHERKETLATNNTKTDEFVYDFAKTVAGGKDMVVLVNPTSPLLSTVSLAIALERFSTSQCASLHSVTKRKVHCYFGDKYNHNRDGMLEKTQDLPELTTMAFAFTAWRVDKFIESYERFGHAYWLFPIMEYAIPQIEAIDIDEESDWQLAEKIITGTVKQPEYFKYET